MIERTIEKRLRDLSRQFPIVTLTGPRQSGKSTLLKSSFPDYRYVSLEDPDIRMYAESDPRGFLTTYPGQTIIDEAQRVPSLFSYLQTFVDQKGDEGMFFLAGSHNFLLMEGVNQSLAGRTAVLKLLPFSHREMCRGGILPTTVDEEIFTGAYPRIYDKNIQADDYYSFYIQTYVERDVRMIKNIGDLSRFVRFVKLCAGRIGQLLNLSSLANEAGVSVSTASAWLSVLEASYLCYFLKPDFNNFAKRLVKSPKLFFYDTGLACSLLGIKSPQQLSTHYLRGGLFENLVVNEFIKRSFNGGAEPDLTFWRDSTGNEIDLIDHTYGRMKAYEIKSGSTFSPDYFKGLAHWSKLSGVPAADCSVIYTGDNRLSTANGGLQPWSGLEL